LNYTILVNATFGIFPPRLAFFLFLELAVVFAEWRMLLWAFPGRKKDALNLSIAMNSASYLLGVLIFGTGY